MFAFNTNRHAFQVQPGLTHDGSGRAVRTAVSHPAPRPAGQPGAPVPPVAPAEPDHERAYPQADGTP